MSRKLIVLNVVLVAGLVVAGLDIRSRWLEAGAREQATLEKKIQPAPEPPVPAVQPVQPIQPGNYLEVASKLLFSSDRNPDVVIEKPEEKPAPPLPIAHGVMDFGSGATLILSEKAGGEQKSYRQGDKVGPFTLASISKTEVVFDWEGKHITKAIEDIKYKEQAVAPDLPASPQGGNGVVSTKIVQEQTAKEVVEAAQKPKDGGPGIDIGGAVRACSPSDASVPAGAVVGGFRKVVSSTPFGASCRWEPAR